MQTRSTLLNICGLVNQLKSPFTKLSLAADCSECLLGSAEFDLRLRAYITVYALVTSIQQAKHWAEEEINIFLMDAPLFSALVRFVLVQFFKKEWIASVKWNVTATKSPDSPSCICLINGPMAVSCSASYQWAVLWKEWFTATLMTSLLDSLQSTVHCPQNLSITLHCSKKEICKHISISDSFTHKAKALHLVVNCS